MISWCRLMTLGQCACYGAICSAGHQRDDRIQQCMRVPSEAPFPPLADKQPSHRVHVIQQWHLEQALSKRGRCTASMLIVVPTIHPGQ
jgi:hypothetical protein